MIIWSGYGFLVFVITFVVSLLTELIAQAVTGNENIYQQTNLPLSFALLVSGVICWFLGRRLNKPGDRVLVDQSTGEEVKLNNAPHRLFFIKMEYWAPLLIVFAIVNLFT